MTQWGQHYGSLNDNHWQTSSNHLGSPPPPYPLPTPPPSGPPRNPSHNEERASSPDETASLVDGNKVRRHGKARVVQIAIPVFFVMMLTALFTATSVLSVAVKRDLTEWQHVNDELMRDMAHIVRLREQESVLSDELQHLRETKSAVSDDIQRLRIQRDEERLEWEREREANEQRRRGHMPFWGEARLLTEECPEDRIRQYDAPLHNLLVEDDWYAACMNSAIDITGRGLASPRTCLNYGLDNGVRGYWSIEVNSSEC